MIKNNDIWSSAQLDAQVLFASFNLLTSFAPNGLTQLTTQYFYKVY